MPPLGIISLVRNSFPNVIGLIWLQPLRPHPRCAVHAEKFTSFTLFAMTPGPAAGLQMSLTSHTCQSVRYFNEQTQLRLPGGKRNFRGPKRQLFLQNEGFFKASTWSLVIQLHAREKWRRWGNHNYQKIRLECTQVAIDLWYNHLLVSYFDDEPKFSLFSFSTASLLTLDKLHAPSPSPNTCSRDQSMVVVSTFLAH